MVVLKGANACYLVGLGANRRDAKHIGCNLADLIALGSPPPSRFPQSGDSPLFS